MLLCYLWEATQLYMGFQCCCPVPNHIIQCMCLCVPKPVYSLHINELCPAMHLLVTPHALQVSYCSVLIFSMCCQYMDPKTIPLKVKELLAHHLFELYINNNSGQASQTMWMSPNKPMSHNNQFIDLHGMESGTVQCSKFACSRELVQPACQRHIYRYGYTALAWHV